MKIKLSLLRGIADTFLYLAVLGMLTGWIGEEFYPYAAVFVFGGLFVNILWLVQTLRKN